MSASGEGRLSPSIIQELLGRTVATEGLAPFAKALASKRILVTGAGGSLGLALARELSALSPAGLVLLENHENSVVALRREVAGPGVSLVLADVRSKEAVLRVLHTQAPQVIFHLAAYKHVDLAEEFPDEYVAANVLATWHLAQAALEAGVERVVYPSSDKAVQPCSVYGATKRASEMLLRCLAASQGNCGFTVARLVNVLGARGSVIDTFVRQISAGQCLTLTHPEMRRYWMTEGEALLLLGYAATWPEPGAILALDVGPPVKVSAVAERLWNRLNSHGPAFSPVYVGVRPGERLEESLLCPGESASACGFAPILRIEGGGSMTSGLPEVTAELASWELLVASGAREELRRRLFAFVGGRAAASA